MQKEVKSTEQSTKTQQNPQRNPRKAATKLKEMQLNLDVMRNRFKVLEGQEQYHRYRTIDHTKRISHHVSVHQTIDKEKNELKKSMEVRAGISDVKAKNEQLRLETKKKIAESRKIMLTQKLERSQLIAEQFVKNQQKIKEIKEKDYELNKAKKSLVLELQEKKRENLKIHYANKIKYTIFQKQKDTSGLNKEVNALQQELSQMMELEKKLSQKYSKSLQTSQLMKSRYNEVVNISQRSVSERLPDINKDKLSSFSQRA